MAKRPVKTSRKNATRPVGRPDHVPDRKTRRIVERCIASGMSHVDIARSIGISWKTLDKYYSDELLNGKARARQEAINMIWASARAGNVSAQRKVIAMTGFDPEAPVGASSEPEEKKKKIGKKEERQNEAENITGKYAPPEPPRLVVNNK